MWHGKVHGLQPKPDHYAALGLDRGSTSAQIRAAYRLLAKRHHPDLNPGLIEAAAQTRELNAAYEILIDPTRRRAYDSGFKEAQTTASTRSRKIERNLAHDVRLRIEDFLRGTSLEVRVNDPANPNGPETYQLTVPPGTAPGARFRLPRAAPFGGGYVDIRVRALPGFRLKVRGSDLRCDLRINAQRAAAGGTEFLTGPTGARLRVEIPRGVARGETLRLAGEGLPKLRGGRGDLLIRVTYRPEVRVTRTTG